MAEDPRSPLELLEALAVEEVEITPDLRHVEMYTMRGLLTLLWHGPRDATRVVVTGGGGMGGLLGPAGGLYHDLGDRFAARRHRHDPRRLPQAERSRALRARPRRRR